MTGSSFSQKHLASVFRSFSVYGDFLQAQPYGSGHINDTFAVHARQAGRPVRYILQRINTQIFRHPEQLMDNIWRITRELSLRLLKEDGENASRRALTLIPSVEGKPYFRDEGENVWRMYLFIEGALGYDVVKNETQAFEAAKAFGEFQKLLTSIPGERLHETIPAFHDTPSRFSRFLEVLESAPVLRKEEAARDIEFFLSRQGETSRLIELFHQGLLPERVTHNDTKLNNVLIDEHTNKAVCVIDLDTSMPGLAPYDFGDLLRTSTVRAREDEKDLSLIRINQDIFYALAKGYLTSASEFLTPCERDNLVFGGKLMTFEVGLRFLTDYLEGNVYFKTQYPEHNLIRSRTQMKLVEEIEVYQEQFEEFVRSEYERQSS